VSRRQARELALQVLFQIDVGHGDLESALFQAFTRELEADDRVALGDKEAVFARDLVQGTWERREEIDKAIFKYAKDWAVDRMANVDRTILRLAIYELRHQLDIPTGVSVDEAVELAKSYSTAESGKFINGILGTLIRDEGISKTASN